MAMNLGRSQRFAVEQCVDLFGERFISTRQRQHAKETPSPGTKITRAGNACMMQDRMLRAAASLLLLTCSAYVAELTIERLFGRCWFNNLVYLVHGEWDYFVSGKQDYFADIRDRTWPKREECK